MYRSIKIQSRSHSCCRCRCADHSEPIRMTFHVAARRPATGRGQSTGRCAIPRNQTAMPGLKPMRHLTMTAIIMRTSHDNRTWSFSALFQGFPISGNYRSASFSTSAYRHPKIIREHSTVPAGAWHLRQSPKSPTILALRGITPVTTPSENALRRIRRQPTIHFVHRTQTSTCR